MTRIVAGTAGGRRIQVPSQFRSRPTAERTREALFASLTTMLGAFDGMRFLDGYAGTGAVGLEALSRGAAHALLVESDRAAAAAIGRNSRTLGLGGGVVVDRPVERLVARQPKGGGYDVVFLDPPYRTPVAALSEVLAAMLARGWLRSEAVVVVERAWREAPFPWPSGIVEKMSRRYGEATLWYGRAQQGRRGTGQC